MFAVADRIDGVISVFIAEQVDILHDDIFVKDIASEGTVVLIDAVAYLKRGERTTDIDRIFLFFFASDGLGFGHAAYVDVVYLLRGKVAEGFVGSEIYVAVEVVELAVCVTLGKGGEILYKERSKRHIVRFVVCVFQIVLQIDRLTVVGIRNRFIEFLVFGIFKNIALVVGINEVVGVVGIGHVGRFGRFFGGGGFKVNAVKKHQKEKHKERADKRENAFLLLILWLFVLFHQRGSPFLFGV